MSNDPKVWSFVFWVDEILPHVRICFSGDVLFEKVLPGQVTTWGNLGTSLAHPVLKIL